MKFKGIISAFDSNALLYEHHIPIPVDVYAAMLKQAPDKRVKCSFDNGFVRYAAMLPSKNSYHYILLNKDIMKKMKWNIGDIVEVQLEKTDLKYGIPICEELEAVLNSDPEGSDFFHALTIGAQHSLIHIINKFKNPQLRLDRSIILLRHLCTRHGNLDFKILNTNFKEGIYIKPNSKKLQKYIPPMIILSEERT
jgi:hypothetical protein